MSVQLAAAAGCALAQQIESELGAELPQIEGALEQERPRTGEVLDSEVPAATRAREPLPPAAQDPHARAQRTEDIKRLTHPLRGRKSPRGGRRNRALTLSYTAQRISSPQDRAKDV